MELKGDSYDPLLWSELMYSKIYNLLKSERTLDELIRNKSEECYIFEAGYEMVESMDLLMKIFDTNSQDAKRLTTKEFKLGCVFCDKDNLIFYMSLK
jgi:hypothetical protein